MAKSRTQIDDDDQNKRCLVVEQQQPNGTKDDPCTMTVLPCTCQQPERVDLDDVSSSAAEDLLLRNLEGCGWSPIQIHLTEYPPPSATEIAALFRSTEENDNDIKNHPDLVYRTAESGGEAVVEPKESLELSLSKTTASPSSSCQAKTTKVHQWCRAMSLIASRVCDQLHLTSNVLLDNATGASSLSLDLLRVFYYHATSTSQLGSSPHTDWGSWTIVWQDSVGGLETYCRSCHKWVGVRSPSPDLTTSTAVVAENHDKWQCIVHVGDMASLALTTSTFPAKDGSSSSPPSCSDGDTPAVRWPSPRHRVVTSPQERASLVFFGYPPADSTIVGIQASLQAAQWHKRYGRHGCSLPLHDYYLLHDQSVSSEQGRDKDDVASSAAAQQYALIRSKPVKDIIQYKWEQVQR